VNFGYFWPSFRKEDNYFTRVLCSKYKVQISDDPDIFFFTHPYNNDREYKKYKCHRVFLGWENERADWDISDYVLDSDFYNDNPRHKRWPVWASWNPEQLTKVKDIDGFKRKKKFCCMVVSNANAKERIAFFNLLSKYKKVDSGGRFMNNIGVDVADKMDFIRDYKFVISFENSSFPGYTTEKLIEPMRVNSIPIYWGNPEVAKDFNTASFVNIPNAACYNEAIEKIIEMDQDEDKYLDMASEPWFSNNELPEEMSEQSLLEYFDFVINDIKTKKPIALSTSNRYSHELSLVKQYLLGKVYGRLKIRRGFR
jgi:hypothetical protein